MLSHSVLRLVALAAVLSLGFVGIARAEDTAAPPATQASGVTGLWTWEQEGPGGSREIELDLKQDGEKLTGTVTGFQDDLWDIEEGTIKDGKISFKVTRDFGGTEMITYYTAKVEGEKLVGESKTVFGRGFEATRAQP
jgi:hypothetical protein